MFELPPLVLGRRSLGGRSQPNLVFQFVSSQFSVFSYQQSVSKYVSQSVVVLGGRSLQVLLITEN